MELYFSDFVVCTSTLNFSDLCSFVVQKLDSQLLKVDYKLCDDPSVLNHLCKINLCTALFI